MIGRNDPCWCGSGQKWKKCHFPVESGKKAVKDAKADAKGQELRALYFKKYQILLKTEEQIDGIRAACHLSSKILDALCEKAKAGVTTLELDALSRRLTNEAGATAASLGYGDPPFPKSICTSLNEVICHGIPNETPLKEGDIVNIDYACILNGYFGDCSRMVCIGTPSPEKQRVVDVSHECLMRSIAILKPGIPISKIGSAIEDYAAAHDCSVVNQFVGHGVGIQYHEAPQIPHHRNSLGILLVPGMTFTIEPMINAGVREAVIDRHDQWTARTRDGKPSAQWEHTVLITDDGYEILTPWKR
ncbi:MAG: methionyl aminopeptidase [Parachlamydia sp.]|nr:methionyl aminopeptidase [Parachlamydia sp.]